MRPASERPKRRHARPHQLDSEDDDDDNDEDEGKEADSQIQGEEMIPAKAAAIVPEDSAAQNLVNWHFS